LLDWAVGIDLGGTNIRVAKVDVLGKVSQPIFVEIDKSYADSPNFAQIISIVEGMISSNQEHPPLGIGFGVTGPINVETGIIDNPFTLPAYFQGNIKKTLEEKFNLKVVVENDANAACIGEAIFGAGEGALPGGSRRGRGRRGRRSRRSFAAGGARGRRGRQR
jgi:glucokinase